MKSERDAVLVIGSLNYDKIMKVPHFPVPGENIIASQVDANSGGKGANQATQCAKLGLQTYMVGCIGNDSFGTYLTDSLISSNVITDYIKVVNSAETGFAAVNYLPDGSVSATIARGANFSITKQDIDDISFLFEKASFVMLQLEIPIDVVKYSAELAKKSGCRLIFNAAPAVDIPEILLNSDYFIVNEVEASCFMKACSMEIPSMLEAAKGFAKQHNNTCIITLGENGCVYANKDEYGFVPANKVAVAETTGAGDSFIGGIAYSLVNDETLENAVKFATLCSSFTIQNVGAQSAMPWLRQLIT